MDNHFQWSSVCGQESTLTCPDWLAIGSCSNRGNVVYALNSFLWMFFVMKHSGGDDAWQRSGSSNHLKRHITEMLLLSLKTGLRLSDRWIGVLVLLIHYTCTSFISSPWWEDQHVKTSSHKSTRLFTHTDMNQESRVNTGCCRKLHCQHYLVYRAGSVTQ